MVFSVPDARGYFSPLLRTQRSAIFTALARRDEEID